MAMTTTAHAPHFAAQTAALIDFLASANHTLTAQHANAICVALGLSANSDFKEKAKLLRTELMKTSIKLGQSHALEALARMTGFTSYMRAREAMKQEAGDFLRDGFLLRVRVTGEQEPQFTPYASLPEAANVAVEQITTLLSIPREPVFCELRRTPKAVAIEVCRAQGPWFIVELLPYSVGSGNLEVAEFDAESQKTFLERVLRALERGHPGTLALYGVVPQKQAPWHYASFTFTFKESGVRSFMPNERDLFFMLDSMGLQKAEIVDDEAHLFGSEGSAKLEMAWSRYDGLAPVKTDISANTLQTLVDRFWRWRRGLSVSIKDAVLLISTGSTDATAAHALNASTLTAEREKQGFSWKILAERAEIPEQSLQRIEKFGFAPEQAILAIAQGLSIDPNVLVDKPEGQVGFEITEAEHLVNSLKNVHQYGVSFPDDLDSETVAFIKATAEGLQDLGDVMAMSDGVFSNEANLEPVKPEHLIEHAEALLESIRDEGLMLIAARGLSFAKGSGRLAGIDGMPLYNVTFRFQPSATAADLKLGG